MIRGSAKIEFHDSKTGVLLETIESDNLVTNAFTNVINGGLNYAFLTHLNTVGNRQSPLNIFNADSMVKALFGGVLVFSKSIPAEADHIIPTADEITACIGHAGQTAGVVGDTYGGNFNASESVFEEDYTTLVWDFTSEQCNGQISCICLTSNRGGIAGLQHSGTSVPGYTFTSTRDEGMYNAKSTAMYAGGLYKLDRSESNACLRFLDKETLGYLRGTLYTRAPLPKRDGDKFVLRLSDGIGRVGGILTASRDTIGVPAVYTYIDQLDLDKGYSLPDFKKSGEVTITEFNSKGTATDITIDLTNIVSSVTEKLDSVGISRIERVTVCASYNDKFYITYQGYSSADSTNYYVFTCLSKDGTFNISEPVPATRLQAISGTTDLRFSYVRFFDGLYLTIGAFNILLPVDIETGNPKLVASLFLSNVSSTLRVFDKLPYLREPWFAGYITGQNNECYSQSLFCPYLATINNISGNPIKTADKTMKIVYTLRQS